MVNYSRCVARQQKSVLSHHQMCREGGASQAGGRSEGPRGVCPGLVSRRGVSWQAYRRWRPQFRCALLVNAKIIQATRFAAAPSGSFGRALDPGLRIDGCAQGSRRTGRHVSCGPRCLVLERAEALARVGRAEEEDRRGVAKNPRLVLASSTIGWRWHQWQVRGEGSHESGQVRSRASGRRQFRSPRHVPGLAGHMEGRVWCLVFVHRYGRNLDRNCRGRVSGFQQRQRRCARVIPPAGHTFDQDKNSRFDVV